VSQDSRRDLRDQLRASASQRAVRVDARVPHLLGYGGCGALGCQHDRASAAIDAFARGGIGYPLRSAAARRRSPPCPAQRGGEL
jgi:hypothetical protein